MVGELYKGGHRRCSNACKFKSGNLVVLNAINYLGVRTRKLEKYFNERAVVIGFCGRRVASKYTIMFKDGSFASVTSSMVKKLDELPTEEEFKGWEKYVQPEEYKFKRAKIDHKDTKIQLQKLRRFGFIPTEVDITETVDLKLRYKFPNMKMCEIIATSNYYSVLESTLTHSEPQVKELGINVRDAVPIYRMDVLMVDSSSKPINRINQYACFVPFADRQTHGREPTITFKMITARELKHIYTMLCENRLMKPVSDLACKVSDVEMSSVLNI